MTPEEFKLTVRAFEIADKAMLSVLTCNCMRGDDVGKTWVPFCDGKEVNSVAEADDAIQEAVEWCVARGLAEVIDGTNDETILLKEPYFS